MLMISEKATTLYVRSAISDIRELLGPHGSLDVASLTLGTTHSVNRDTGEHIIETSPFVSRGG